MRSTPLLNLLFGSAAAASMLMAGDPLLAQSASPAPAGARPQAPPGDGSVAEAGQGPERGGQVGEPAGEAEAGSMAGDIVVTARRREESLLEAPVTITAFSAEALRARDIRTLNDVADFTPNVTLTNQGGSRVDRTNQTFIIRGMNPQSSATASTFIDGAPVIGGFVEGLEDVERVEILKGPQSAAFGRQAFAGAINIVTKTPSETLSGRIDGTYGSEDWVDARVTLEGPIVPDLLSFRISPRYFSRKGQYENRADPGTTLGDQSTRSLTGSLLFKPAEGLNIKYFGQYFHDRDGPSAVAHFGRADFNCNAGAAPAGTLNYICGTAPRFPLSRLGQNVAVDQLFTDVILRNSLGLVNPLFKSALGLREGGLKRLAQHHHLSIDYAIPDLGIVLRSLSATNSTKSSVITDLDLADTRAFPNPNFGVRPNTQPFVNSLFNFQGRTVDRSQEFRMETDNNGPLSLLVGASYVYARVQSASSAILATGPSLQLNGNPVVTKTTGFFGSLSYDITDRLTLSAEGRYQIDKVTLFNRGLNDGPLTRNLSGTFKNFLPRVIAKFEFIDGWNTYASWSRGANPGTFNANFPSLTQAQRDFLTSLGAGVRVDPEKLENYELGVKGRFWGGRGQIQAAVYHAIWSDQIVNQPIATTQPNGGTVVINAITNIGKTKLNGFEVEGAVQPVEGLTFNFSAAFADSNIRNFFCATCGAQTGDPLVNGNELPRYSKYTGAAGLDYRAALTTSLDWFGRADYIFKSGVWDSPANIVKTQDSHRFNFRAGIKNETWSLEAFVLNAFNDRAYLSIENNVDLVPGGTRALNLLMPTLRQYGVRGRFNF